MRMSTNWSHLPGLNGAKLSDRMDYSLDQRNFLKKNRGVLLLSLVVLVAAIIMRSLPHYLNPGLHVEDTTH